MQRSMCLHTSVLKRADTLALSFYLLHTISRCHTRERARMHARTHTQTGAHTQVLERLAAGSYHRKEGLPDPQATAGDSDTQTKPKPPWLSDRAYAAAQHLSYLRRGSPLQHLLADISAFRTFVENTESSAPLPAAWEAQLSALEMWVLKDAIRPDLAAHAAADFVGQILGDDAGVLAAGRVAEADLPARLEARTSNAMRPVVVLVPSAAAMASTLAAVKVAARGAAVTLVSVGDGGVGENACGGQQSALVHAMAEGAWLLVEGAERAPDWVGFLAPFSSAVRLGLEEHKCVSPERTATRIDKAVRRHARFPHAHERAGDQRAGAADEAHGTAA